MEVLLGQWDVSNVQVVFLPHDDNPSRIYRSWILNFIIETLLLSDSLMITHFCLKKGKHGRHMNIYHWPVLPLKLSGMDFCFWGNKIRFPTMNNCQGPCYKSGSFLQNPFLAILKGNLTVKKSSPRSIRAIDSFTFRRYMSLNFRYWWFNLQPITLLMIENFHEL